MMLPLVLGGIVPHPQCTKRDEPCSQCRPDPACCYNSYVNSPQSDKALMFNRLRNINPFRQSLEKTRESVFKQVTNLFTHRGHRRRPVGRARRAARPRRSRRRHHRRGGAAPARARRARPPDPGAAADGGAARRADRDARRGRGRAAGRVATPPSVIVVVGVNGVGQDHLIAKLAQLPARQSQRRVLIAAGDTFRAAAVEQLNLGRAPRRARDQPSTTRPTPAPWSSMPWRPAERGAWTT